MCLQFGHFFRFNCEHDWEGVCHHKRERGFSLSSHILCIVHMNLGFEI